MKFGICLDSHVAKWEVVREAEEIGFHRAFYPDTQMIWSDCYAAMAVAATKTSKILLGTGVTNPATRIAPVTACAIGSINRLAPGRAFLGIGTGHTAMRVMGQPSATISKFRDYVRVVRALLDGEAVDYSFDGRTTEVQLIHQQFDYVNLKDRIPIYVAANGPKALQVAAEFGDGWVTAGGITSDLVAKGMVAIQNAMAAVGRELDSHYLTANMISACVLQPGEKLTDRRVVDQTGSMVTGNLHFMYEIWESAGRPDSLIPESFADVWDAYVARVAAFSLPPETRYRQIHEGHATYLVEEERSLVTPAGIRASCVVGTPHEIIEQLEMMEAAGMREIALVPPADHQRGVFRDFAQNIIPHFANRD